jgi:phosphoribosylanthranilate isomerase
MSLWVKICGNTTLEDAQLAADAGADAVGFVFAPSPRRVTPDQVATITPSLPPFLEKIGVFVDADLTTISASISQCGLTGVQLQSANVKGIARELRERFGASFRILQVIHFAEDAGEQLAKVQGDPSLDGILVDSRTATAVGGTGIAFDWKAARSTVFNQTARLKLVVAGGLHRGNVAEAIAILQPWGVDVVSGVEASPGRKDAEKVRAFITTAHASVSSQQI